MSTNHLCPYCWFPRHSVFLAYHWWIITNVTSVQNISPLSPRMTGEGNETLQCCYMQHRHSSRQTWTFANCRKSQKFKGIENQWTTAGPLILCLPNLYVWLHCQCTLYSTHCCCPRQWTCLRELEFCPRCVCCIKPSFSAWMTYFSCKKVIIFANTDLSCDF